MTLRSPGRRHGFTLLELLVVLSIIAILASLLAAGLFRYQAAARITRTDETLTKINAGFEPQWKAALDQARKEPLPEAVLAAADGDIPRARALHVQARMRQEFPEKLSEIKTYTVTAGGKSYSYTAKASYTAEVSGVAFPDTTTESGALLVLALKQARGGARFDETSLGGTVVFTYANGGKTLTVYRDAWNNPIGFYRKAPTVLCTSELNAAPYISGTTYDPLDPENKLTSAGWNATNRNAVIAAASLDLQPTARRQTVRL